LIKETRQDATRGAFVITKRTEVRRSNILCSRRMACGVVLEGHLS
jgi:hypothetical protein